MLEYQRIVDEIQGSIGTPGLADPDLLRDAAAQFAEACAEVNGRLRESVMLLRKGLRTEAIHMAEREPNLLDVAAILDFPELPDWRDMLQQWGMSPPPPLLIDLAAELNEAYAEEEPLQALLKNHRLLALGRSPLPARIHTLRRMRDVDPQNVAWQEDLRQLERARLKQIDGQSEHAFKLEDERALLQLTMEVEDPQWLVSPTTDLVERVRDRHLRLSIRCARTMMESLEQRLTAAYSAFDVEAGQNAREQWEACDRVARLRDDDPLQQRAAPALDWLADQDELARVSENYEQAIGQLERALDDRAPRETLEKRYHAVARFEDGVPALLERRLRSQVEAFELAGRRKHRLIVMAVIGAVLIVGGGATMLTLHQMNRREVASAVQMLQKMLAEERLAEAQKFLEGLESTAPPVAQSSEIQTLAGQLKTAQRTEDERRLAFEGIIGQLLADGLENPNSDALAEAHKLAKTAQENGKLRDFELQVEAARRARQKEMDEQFSVDLKVAQESLAQLESKGGYSDRDLARLTAQLKSLSGQGLVNALLLRQVEPLQIRLKALEADQAVRDQRETELKAITAEVGNAQRYSAALAGFAKKFPETADSRDFDQAAKELPLWQGAAAWDAFLSDARFQKLSTLLPSAAQELLPQGKKLLVDHGDSPGAEYFRQREAYLTSVAARLVDGKKLVAQLEELLADPLVKKLWYVESRDKRYYALKEPMESNDYVVFSYVTGFELTEKKISLKTNLVTARGIAPQSLLRDQILGHLKTLDAGNWESTFYKVLREIQATRQMDPVLKFVFLKRTFEIASQGSSCLGEAFAEHRQILDDPAIDLAANWVSPDDADAPAARSRIEAVLDRLPDLTDAAKKAALLRQACVRPPDPAQSWIGWLARGSDNKWNCMQRKPAEGSGALFVLIGSPIGEPKWAQLGRLSKGDITWAKAPDDAWLVGRPIYLRPVP